MIFVTVSTGHFDPLIAECDRLFRQDPQKYAFFGQIGCSQPDPSFPFVPVMDPQSLDEAMAQAELVVTHAGTGMLSRLYRLQKKAIVIPKQIRYGEANDGQVELAVKWAELGMAVLCLEVKELEKKIALCRQSQLTFPQFPHLGSSLQKELS